MKNFFKNYILDLVFLTLILVGFIVSEKYRYSNPHLAFYYSILGICSLLTYLFHIANSLRTKSLNAPSWIEIFKVFCAVAATLWTVYWGSGIAKWGAHVDTIYTYESLMHFLTGQGALNFNGNTFSYPAFTGYILMHLPASLLGIEVLGPGLTHFGPVLVVAMALTSFLLLVNPKVSIRVCILTALLFSNKPMLQSYNVIIYSITGICIAFILLTYSRKKSPFEMFLFSVLMSIPLWIQYSGFFFLIPIICVFYARLIYKKELLQFFKATLPLHLTLFLCGINFLQRPILFTQRLSDIRSNAPAHPQFYQITASFQSMLEQWFSRNSGSWFMLNTPTIGWVTAALLFALVILSLWVSHLKYLKVLAIGFTYTLFMTVVLFLVSDLFAYRTYPLLFTLTSLCVAWIPLYLISNSQKNMLRALLVLIIPGVIGVSELRGPYLKHLPEDGVSLNVYSSLGENAALRERMKENLYIVTDSPFTAAQLGERLLKKFQLHGIFIFAHALCSDPAAWSSAEAKSDGKKPIWVALDERSCNFENLVSQGFKVEFRDEKRSVSYLTKLETLQIRTHPLFENIQNSWKVTDGTAFGNTLYDCRKSLPQQQPIYGYESCLFFNSYHGGDSKHGVIESAPFKIEFDAIRFKVGGGRLTNNLKVVLIVDGIEIKKSAGEDKEILMPKVWNVQDFKGKTALIRLEDSNSDSWGHLLVSDWQKIYYLPETN